MQLGSDYARHAAKQRAENSDRDDNGSGCRTTR